MDENFFPLDKVPDNPKFKKGDLFILFGELFNRGYANGLIREAKKIGMQIIGLTVGRREGGKTRPLNAEELKAAQELIGGEIINIPLEAGFDNIPTKYGTVTDVLAGLKFSDWMNFKVQPELVPEAVELAEINFKKALSQIMEIIEKKYQPGQNVYFSHIMAGGIIRNKVLLLIVNRMFRSTDERILLSDDFWHSELGQIAARNFDEVTANTYKYLLDGTKNFRQTVAKNGQQVSYSGYGYHGCQIYLKGKYQWQTFTPYQQGYAKKKLENYSREAVKEGIHSVIFNCPEVRTSSSDLFLGTDFPLLLFLKAVQLETKKEIASEIWENCAKKLKSGFTIESLIKKLEDYFDSPAVKESCYDFLNWPEGNTKALTTQVVNWSNELTALHIDPKDLMTEYLSFLLINTSGSVILNSMLNINQPVVWVGHKILAQHLNRVYPPN